MKRSNKKLVLQRQTLKPLDDRQLQNVAGGLGSGSDAGGGCTQKNSGCASGTAFVCD